MSAFECYSITPNGIYLCTAEEWYLKFRRDCITFEDSSLCNGPVVNDDDLLHVYQEDTELQVESLAHSLKFILQQFFTL